MKKCTGVTLLELMITISIAAILLAAGAPSFMQMLAKNRLEASSNDFVSSLNLARSEAVLRNVRTTVCRSSDGTSCGGEWEDGWIVFVDDGGTPGVVEVGEEIVLVNDGFDRADYTLRGNNNVSNRISFGAQGYSLGFNGQLALCYDEDHDGAGDFDDQNGRVTIISSSGRIRTVKPSDGDVSLGDCTP
jgi:type IV fimbrial biogenesis protein FimT